MKVLIPFLSFLLLAVKVYPQVQYMDLTTVSALIEANIQEYQNKKKRERKGLEYTLVTKILKDEEDKIKKVHNKLQSRMNSLFILLADADLLIRVTQETSLIYKYQEEALIEAIQKPYLYPAVVKNEQEVVNRVKNVILFLTLIVNAYGDIANMKVDDRRKIYSQVVTDLTIIRIKSQAMAQTFKNMSFADAVKSTRVYDILQQDKQKVQEIISNLSF